MQSATRAVEQPSLAGRLKGLNGFSNGSRPTSPEEASLSWSIKKRDGRTVPFDPGKIRSAVRRCFQSVQYESPDLEIVIDRIARGVVGTLMARHQTCVDVEEIQRYVIAQLWSEGKHEAAEHYTLYREEHRKLRAQQPIAASYSAAVAEDAKHFPTALQYYQFIGKFARWLESAKRRETWREACDRVLSWFKARPKIALSDAEWAELSASMYELHTAPAMRVLQMAGPALDRCCVGAFNCAYMPIDDLFSFSELLYVLMQGTGCGFSVEDEYISRLPRIKRQKQPVDPKVYRIADDTEGWCDALYVGLKTWFNGEDVTFDYGLIRPAGERLRIKGGRSSGPEPLRELLDFARMLILGRQGKVLTDLDCHDLACKTAKIVQVGGVRRASCISLSDLSSTAMRDAKSGNWYGQHGHRVMANNSAVYSERPSAVKFMEEWLALAKSGSGERGIFNRKAAMLHSPARRKKHHEFGVNPCAEITLRPRQFCVSGSTPLITRDGLVRIGDAEGRTVGVWNGDRWSSVVIRCTRKNQRLVRVRFSDGSFLDTTPDHGFSVSTADSRFKRPETGGLSRVEASKLRQRMATEPFIVKHDGGIRRDDAYTVGVVFGDGSIGKRSDVVLDLYGEKMHLPVSGNEHTPILKAGYNVESRRIVIDNVEMRDFVAAMRADMESTWFSIAEWDRRSILEFVAGLADTDGSETGTGGIRCYVSGRFRADMLQLLLTKCGIRSSVCLMQEAGSSTNFGRRQTDMWYVQITDCGEIPCHRLNVSDGHVPTCKSKYQTVMSVEWLPGAHDVFCFEESEQHKGVFNNTLTYQCNLSIVVARPDDTRESLCRKVRLAAYWGTMQATCTDFRYIREEWKQNCDEEALLGVDITGHADCPLLRFDAAGREELLRELRQIVAVTNAELAARFGIRRAAADTCVKPSGDSSVFFNCASGLSPWFAQYRIRWVRESIHSPVAKLLRDEGVPWAVAPEDPSLLVFGFPSKAPDSCTLRNDMTALQQLENWLVWKQNWAEHSVSATIYVEPHEWLDVGRWVYAHFDEITGLSFLDKDNGIYQKPPNEEITEAQYKAMVEKFPLLRWEKLSRYEHTDMTESSQTLACVAGVCSL